jgi:hypothetical protein
MMFHSRTARTTILATGSALALMTAAALAEPAQPARVPVGGRAADEADDRHRRLLRMRHERPCCGRATEQRDELAPFHSMTSSARASSVGGTGKSTCIPYLPCG